MNYSQRGLRIPHGRRSRLKFEVLILLSTSARASVEWAAKRTVYGGRGRGSSAVWRLAFDGFAKRVLIVRQRGTVLHGPISAQTTVAHCHFTGIGFRCR